MPRISHTLDRLLRLPWSPSRRTELLVGVAVAIGSMVLIALQGRELWFFSDVWPVLTTREVTSFTDLMRDHGGHWMVPQTFLIQGLYHVFGLDYWPWFFIPRLVVYAGLCFVLWRTFRWQGVDPWLAFGAYLVLLFLGHSAWQTNVAHIGVLLIECYLVACLLLVARVEAPKAKHQWLLFGLLVLALSTFGSGAAVWGGVGLSLLLFRQLRAWWPAFAGSVAIFVVWYLTFGRLQRAGPMKPTLPSLEGVLAAPGNAVELLTASVETVLFLPTVLSTFFLGGFLLWVLRLALRKQLNLYVAGFFVTLLGYLALVVLVRTAAGVTPVRAPSYTFAALLLMLPPAAILLLRRVGGRWRLPVFLALVVLAFFNARALFETIERRQEVRLPTRPRVEAAAWMIARGEPYVPYTRIDFQLVARHVRKLVEEGWQGAPPTDEAVGIATRGLLRMAPNAPALQGEPLRVRAAPVEAGCTTVAPGQTLQGNVVGPGSILLKQVAQTPLSLEWTDEFGTGVQTLTPRQPQQYVMFARPATTATFRLSGGWTAPISVCGVAR